MIDTPDNHIENYNEWFNELLLKLAEKYPQIYSEDWKDQVDRLANLLSYWDEL